MAKLRITDASSWKALQAHYAQISSVHMRELFIEDDTRFERFSVSSGQIMLDYSKNRITDKTLELLIALAREAGVNQAIKNMFLGERINRSENRAVLHTALRRPPNQPLLLDGRDVMQDVGRVLDQMDAFCEKIKSGQWRGYTGKRIKHIVNIGIGGSDLGPKMVVNALRPYWDANLKSHFIANIDASDLCDTLEVIDPETSLFIIASKTFTTQETMANAQAARRWFLDANGSSEADIRKHFVAVSSAPGEAEIFGIPRDNMFEFWDWVGGRYSLWSAIGLSISLMVGMPNFRALLAGAREMDVHFHDTPFEQNLPVILAVLGVWYRDFFNASSYAILPYDHSLRKFTAYLQQSDMESNGKSITLDGDGVDYPTGPVVWGAVGANAQHAFYQLIHQGTELVPADFVAPIQSHHRVITKYGEHHNLLLANCVAQTKALMWGQEKCEVERYLVDKPALVPHCTFDGNRPSNTLLIDKITPHNLGALIALYEHKIFVQGVIWNINSFDQWGVELGKKLSKNIASEIDGKPARKVHDHSTSALIKHILKRQQSTSPE